MNPAKNSTETSEEGVELGVAWFECASDYEKNQYRNARDKNQAEYLRILMKAGLIAKIRDGKLVSFGLRVAPNLSEARERIPAFLFTDLGQSDVILKDIDWKKSALRSAGREYVQVRVSRPHSIEPANERPSPATLGRPRIDGLLRAIVRDLLKADLLSGKSRKEQENLVRTKAREKHPDLFPTATRPSREKIREALKSEKVIRGQREV